MKPPRGLSLIELLIAMAIGLGLLLTVSSLLVNAMLDRSRERRQAQLGEMVDASLSLMAMELRRAGYWRDDGKANPYGQLFIEEDGQCLRYAYDAPPGSADRSQRYFAFRLRYQGKPAYRRGVLQRLASDQAGWSCLAADKEWSALSALDIGQVESLRFSEEADDRGIGIALQAAAPLPRGERVTLAIRTSVALRNRPQVVQP
ncbi:hypothetical protein CEK28_08945 [Xenophilus sp. AP218F]|nr:hypothetical protein CEK28_08945 [Xenophilus sp. AP218F]